MKSCTKFVLVSSIALIGCSSSGVETERCRDNLVIKIQVADRANEFQLNVSAGFSAGTLASTCDYPKEAVEGGANCDVEGVTRYGSADPISYIVSEFADSVSVEIRDEQGAVVFSETKSVAVSDEEVCPSGTYSYGEVNFDASDLKLGAAGSAGTE